VNPSLLSYIVDNRAEEENRTGWPTSPLGSLDRLSSLLNRPNNSLNRPNSLLNRLISLLNYLGLSLSFYLIRYNSP